MRSSFINLTIFALLLIPSLLIAIPTDASSTKGVRLSPINHMLNLSPGEAFSNEFTLTNNESTIISVTISKFDLIPLNDTYEVKLDAASSEAATDWITVSETTFELDPGEQKSLTITGSIPASATSGAYHIGIGAKWKSTDSQSIELESSITYLDPLLTYRLDLNVVPVTPTISVDITRLSTNNPVLNGTVTINYEITNPTTQFIRPIAYLQLLDRQGYPAWRKVINDELKLLEPAQTISGSVDINLEELQLNFPGQLELELLAVDQQFHTNDVGEATFLVLPWWSIMLGGLTLVVIGIVGQTLRNRRKR